jgi:ssDNA-binding Zn-finger/Zn-ribbon topoisomerase 1
MTAIAEREPSTIIASTIIDCPACPQKLRIREPRHGYKLQVRCGNPLCNTEFDYPRPRSAPLIVPRMSPAVPAHANIVLPATPLQDNAPRALQSGAVMLKKVYGEMRVRCSKTGAPWSAVFEQNPNSGAYVFWKARAGDDLTLELMFAALTGNPDFRAAAPEAMNFASGSLLFGNMTCPCCAFKSRPGYRVTWCNHCESYICAGTQREVRPDWEEAICHPHCASYPRPLVLRTDDSDVRGYQLTIYQRERKS